MCCKNWQSEAVSIVLLLMLTETCETQGLAKQVGDSEMHYCMLFLLHFYNKQTLFCCSEQFCVYLNI